MEDILNVYNYGLTQLLGQRKVFHFWCRRLVLILFGVRRYSLPALDIVFEGHAPHLRASITTKNIFNLHDACNDCDLQRGRDGMSACGSHGETLSLRADHKCVYTKAALDPQGMDINRE